MTTAVDLKFRIDPWALLDQHRPRIVAESRKSKRVEWETAIAVAPYDGATLPPPDAFQEVLTHDVSPTGLSFYQLVPPDASQVVLQFGSADRPIRLVANVARLQQGHYLRRRQFLVGCQFTGLLAPGPLDLS